MQKTKIEWTDYTWNPIKGLCPVDCKLPDGRSYCYAKRIYQRFKWNPKIGFELHDHVAIDRLQEKISLMAQRFLFALPLNYSIPKFPNHGEKIYSA